MRPEQGIQGKRFKRITKAQVKISWTTSFKKFDNGEIQDLTKNEIVGMT